MQGRILWMLASIVLYGVILVGSKNLATGAVWIHGVAYFVFGICLLGAIARWWRAGSPVLWRPLMLGLGGFLAAGEIGWRAGSLTGPAAEQWMAGLLGLLVVALMARLMPAQINRRWLGMDRRERERAD